MWDLKACRSCLSTQDKLERATETSRRIYASVTGLEFNTGDGYPTYFCVECTAQLKKCLSFRRKSRRAYYALNRFMTSKKQITLTDIVTVNRRRNNLESSIGSSKQTGFACFQITEGPTVTEITDEPVTINEVPVKTLTAQEFYHEFLSGNKLKVEAKEETIDKQPEQPTGKNNLEKYEPVNIGNVYQTVLIKSDDQLEEEKTELLKVLEENADATSNDIEADYLEEDPKKEIDLDDVFKDLVEDAKNSESETEVEVHKTVRQKREERKQKKKEQLLEREKENRVNKVSKALAFCEVKHQSAEEKVANWQKKMQLEPYKSARVKCLVCVKPFEKIEQLMEHVKFHNDINSNGTVVPCPICKANFSSEDEFEKHHYEMHLYVYDCKLCDAELYTLEDFSGHYYANHYTRKVVKKSVSENLAALYTISQLSTEEMKQTAHEMLLPSAFQCGKCQLYFKTAHSLTLHSRKHDLSALSPLSAVCEYCETWFASKYALQSHMERWHLYSYTCKMCKLVMYCREDALKHRDKHMVKGQLDTDCTCSYCGAQTNVRSLDFHIFRHHYTDKYRYHCVVCGKSSSRDVMFYKHQLEEHDRIILPSLKIGNPEFTCNHCDVQFVNQNAYYTHLLKHRHPEASDIPLACTVCRVRFETEDEYKFHQRRCRSRKYPRNCVYCNIVLTSTADSVKHYMTVHKDLSYHRLGPTSKCLRYVLCEICGASVKSSKIAGHRRVHEEGLLRCGLCAAEQFTTPRQVVLHVLKSHCDKPFICMICQFKFKQRAQCRDHILKTHAPVRPYSCVSCPLKFSHVDYLNDHAFKIHAVPLPGRGPKKKLRGVCTTYPHMQVDVSLVPENVLKDVQFRICDYHDRNLTPLRDISRFFLTNRQTPVQPPILAEIEVQLKTLKRSYEEYQNSPSIKKYKVEDQESESVNEVEVTVKSKNEEIKVESVPDYQDFDTEVLDEEVLLEEDIKIDEDTYEVVEGEDGDQYVCIDDVMYRIEQQEE